jgi:predicted dehydrogenase
MIGLERSVGVAPFKIALVGCGIISEFHIRAYQRFPERAQIAICCDLDPVRAADRAVLAGAQASTSFEQVLADPTITAIELCTPHHLHPQAVIAAAQAGKHILCQKPLARTLAECEQMIQAARTAGVTLFYAEIMRTMPEVVLAAQAIADGRIGHMIGIQATYAHWQGGQYLSTAWRYDPTITGGGQLLDGGIHFIDMLLQLGGPIEAVSCMTQRFRPELGGEDTAVLNLRFAAGHLGSLFSSQAAGVWFPGASLVAFGTEGILTIGGPHGALVLHREDLPEKREVLIAERGDVFAAMIAAYLDTLEGRIANPAPGEIGYENLRVVLAAYESARTKREVVLSEIAPAWG